MICYDTLRKAMLQYAMLCYAMLRYATLCYDKLCYARHYWRDGMQLGGQNSAVETLSRNSELTLAESAGS